jgi:hypothetical protein
LQSLAQSFSSKIYGKLSCSIFILLKGIYISKTLQISRTGEGMKIHILTSGQKWGIQDLHTKPYQLCKENIDRNITLRYKILAHIFKSNTIYFVHKVKKIAMYLAKAFCVNISNEFSGKWFLLQLFCVIF